MKKPIPPLLTGFLLGIGTALFLDRFLSNAGKKTTTESVQPETIESLDRKRIIAIAEERYADASELKNAINKIKYNGHTN